MNRPIFCAMAASVLALAAAPMAHAQLPIESDIYGTWNFTDEHGAFEYELMADGSTITRRDGTQIDTGFYRVLDSCGVAETAGSELAGFQMQHLDDDGSLYDGNCFPVLLDSTMTTLVMATPVAWCPVGNPSEATNGNCVYTRAAPAAAGWSEARADEIFNAVLGHWADSRTDQVTHRMTAAEMYTIEDRRLGPENFPFYVIESCETAYNSPFATDGVVMAGVDSVIGCFNILNIEENTLTVSMSRQITSGSFTFTRIPY